MDPNNQPPNNSTQTNQGSTPGVGNNTVMAILSYLGILVLVPLLTGAKSDPFVKFHIGQGLTLLITFIVSFIVGIIPILGWILSPLLMLFCFVLVILGIINAVSGAQKELPIIGKFAGKFNL